MLLVVIVSQFACPPRETLLQRQNLLPGKQKRFPINSGRSLLQKECFSVCTHVSSTLLRHAQEQISRKNDVTIIACVSNILRSIHHKCFHNNVPSLPTLENMEKQWKETMLTQMFPSLESRNNVSYFSRA